MSQENVETVRRAFEHFDATGEVHRESLDPDFVWDMSTASEWPEDQTYEGIEAVERFLRDWLEAWDEWHQEVESLHDAGDKVVAIMHQRGRAKGTGMAVEMSYAQVITFRDGMQIRSQMYVDRSEAFAAAGLRE